MTRIAGIDVASSGSSTAGTPPAELSPTDQGLIDLEARLVGVQRRLESLEGELKELKALPSRVNSEVDRLEKRINILR